MEKAKYDFKNYEDDALTKPRSKCWDNWFSFEKVGDSVQGYIRDVFFRQADGKFAEARGITLEQENGELINVRIKYLDFILKETNHLRLGDPLTVKFEKEIPAKEKGFSPTKQIAFYGKNMEKNAEEKTVLELENEDRNIVEAIKAQEDAEFDGDEDFSPENTEPEPEKTKEA